MRLLSLDYDPVYGKDATRASFDDDVSAFDYDVVIWDPGNSLTRYSSYQKFQGLSLLEGTASVRAVADVTRRREEFREFVESGRTLVIIVRPPQVCYVKSPGIKRLDFWDAVSVGDPGLERAGGKRIEFDGDGAVVKLLRKYSDRVAYKAIMANAPGHRLAHVPGTSRIVSSVQRTPNGGHLLLLPFIDLEIEDADPDDPHDPEDDTWDPIAPDFYADLLSAIKQLHGSKTMARPAWASRFATQEQRRLGDEVTKQLARVETARKKLSNLQQKKELAESCDQLFLGSGRALELEVKTVLELLGGKVTEPEPGRDDWRVSFPEGDAVVEVKGVTKSAAEKHAAQLEKWVSGAMEETGKLPKGLLIVNTWRERPLDERTEEDFPPQMLPYCEGRGHCLVTGLQLFVMRADIEKDKNRAATWRNSLFETSGIFVGCRDWRSALIETQIEE